MPLYEYDCPECGPHEEYLTIGNAPVNLRHTVLWGAGDPYDMMSWQQCAHRAKRVFSAPYHTEDRRHFRSGISPVTRRPFAQTRSEEKKIEREMNIEFVSKDSRPQSWKEHEEYYHYRKAGGEHIPWREPVKKIPPGTLLRELEKRTG